MTDTIGWDDIPDKNSAVGQKNNDKGSPFKDLFMKLGSDESTIRVVGKPIQRNIAWFPNPNPKGPESPKNIKHIVPDELVARVESMGIEVRPTFAVCVFDRDDTQQGITRLKVLEKGVSIFQAFKSYYKKRKDENGNGIDPGGKNGPDWSIEPQGAGRNTKYTVMPLDAAPWSSEEAKLLKQNPETDENKDKPIGERGFYDSEKKNYILNLIYNEQRAKKKLLEFLDGEGSPLAEESAESITDYQDSTNDEPEKEITSLDELPSTEEHDEGEGNTNASSVVEKQLEKVF